MVQVLWNPQFNLPAFLLLEIPIESIQCIILLINAFQAFPSFCLFTASFYLGLYSCFFLGSIHLKGRYIQASRNVKKLDKKQLTFQDTRTGTTSSTLNVLFFSVNGVARNVEPLARLKS